MLLINFSEVQSRPTRSPKRSPVKENRKAPSPPSPSGAVASARNRSPSASPVVDAEDTSVSRPSLSSYDARLPPLHRKEKLMPGLSSKRNRSSESDSPSPKVLNHEISREYKGFRGGSSGPPQQSLRSSGESAPKHTNGDVNNERMFSKNRSPSGPSDDDIFVELQHRRPGRGGYITRLNVNEPGKPIGDGRPPSQSSIVGVPKSRSPARSPLKYTVSPNLRSSPRKRILSPDPVSLSSRPSNLHVSISSRSESSEVNLVPRTAANICFRPSLVSPVHRSPLSLGQRSSSSGSPVTPRRRPQIFPPSHHSKSPKHTRQSTSPSSSAQLESDRLRDTGSNVLLSNKQRQISRSPSVTHGVTDRQPLQPRTSPLRSVDVCTSDVRRPLRPTDSVSMTETRVSRNPSRSPSSSSAASEGSHTHRSRSRSPEKILKRNQPHSPPAHLVQKWRMRHEQLLQKRRIAPSVSSTFHTPSLSSEDRSHYFEKRNALPGKPHRSRSSSQSDSHSRSPPRRKRLRSSTSHSRSGSPQQRRNHPTVGLDRRISPVHASSESRSVSPEVPKAAICAKSKSRSVSPKQKVRNQATSPVKLPKRSRKKNTVTPMAAEDDPVIEENVEPSKWEKAEEALESVESSGQRKTWTTSHWQTATDQSKAPAVIDKPVPKSDVSESVLQRLRMAQVSQPTNRPNTIEEESVPTSSVKTVEGQVLQTTFNTAVLQTVIPNTVREADQHSSKITVVSKSLDQPKKLRNRSSSSSSSVDSSASSSSGATSASRSCSRSRSPTRHSGSPFSRNLRRRSDFSDSRSRGRGSYYGRYSPISRSRYSRSRSRSFSTYRSTIRSAYSSNRTHRRSSSRSRSRSYSRDSRSPSSRWADGSRGRYSSSHHRRGRRSHRYSGFRRPSSSRSRSSSRSYSSSPRHR